MRLMIAVLAALVVGAGIGFAVADVTGDAESTNAGRALRGVVVLDGAVNGCGGKQIAVQVRDETGVVGSAFADSEVVGADCVFEFAVSVPAVACYRLVIDGTPVGSYADSALRPSYDVGYISAESVFGDEVSGEEPQANSDFSGC